MDRTESLPIGASCGSAVRRPRQNRVTPFGTIEATHHKGALMGNRGDLHALNGTLGQQWRSRRWLSCVLEGNGWKAPMDTPGHYYPLFFHDEAVALAAGHRPCGECRPDALAAFIAAWKLGHGVAAGEWLPLRDIDQASHRSRVREHGSNGLCRLANLPEGTFVSVPLLGPRPLLIFSGRLWPWKHGGYDRPLRWPGEDVSCIILTPPCMLAVLRGGYGLVLDPLLQRVAMARPRR